MYQSTIFQKIEHQLGTEEADPVWSESAEAQIWEAFSDGKMSDAKILNAQCRSTLCVVEVSHNDETSVEPYLTQLQSSLAWDGSTSMVGYNDVEGELVTRVLIARKGAIDLR